ncbi:dihydroorotase [bacterium 1xD42-62]|uniref:Dihydroorotase n=2 Tax=Parablautia muri TaxID=2320879 RepID=A0A9X5GTX8_9FIRM|nr:dihydroorotase [Parablautia muri]
MKEFLLYIKNGTIIDPIGNRLYKGDLQIENGRISRIIRKEGTSFGKDPLADAGAKIDLTARKEESISNVKVIEGEGLMIAPGLADTHVHFRDPGFLYKEDIYTGARAAAKGGFTQIVLMANTKPCVDNENTLSYVLAKGKETNIHIASCANVTKGMAGKELTDMERLSECGAAGFTDDGIPLLHKELVREAMERVKKLHRPISFHEENPALIFNNGINKGKASEFYHIGGSPREAEIDLVKRDLELALLTGADVVIQHISTKEAVELVRRAKEAGAWVHAEATPHHFTLTEEAAIQKGTLAKMNPPLRGEEDRLAIIEGLKDGTIDLIATDHAPHSKEEKEKPITEAPSGIIGLETALSLGIRELVEKGYLTYPELIKAMSTAPCLLYGLEGGRIEEGAAADLVLFHPKERWTVSEFASKSANSPFVGESLPGVVYYTICGGKIVYEKEYCEK